MLLKPKKEKRYSIRDIDVDLKNILKQTEGECDINLKQM